jgi:hypothetical protein
MNSTQKGAVALGLFLAALMGLYPPWCREFAARPDNTDTNAILTSVVVRDVGKYDWVWEPPYYNGASCSSGLRVDMQRLGLQWLCLVFLTAALALTIKPQREVQEKTPAVPTS